MENFRIEWILYDSQTQKLEFCTAKDQKEAIKEALRRNIVPRSTNDVRPRTAMEKTVMKQDEFEEFIGKLTT